MTSPLHNAIKDLIDDMGSWRIPSATVRMIWLHLSKPWVPNIEGIALVPLGPGLEDYLGPVVIIHRGVKWSFPGKRWWLAHAKSSHPPDGAGCDADVHAEYLTPSGKSAEFGYANIFKDGTIKVLDRKDFVEECRWWKKYAATALTAK